MYTDYTISTENSTPDPPWFVRSTYHPQQGGIATLPCMSQPCAVIRNERERIGMDLHDGIIQSLYALGMNIDLLAQAGKLESNLVTSITDDLNDILDEVRLYIRNLQPSPRKQQSIRQRFEEILLRYRAQELLEVELHAPEQIPPFTPATFENICLIVQEAVSNVLRHAHATHLRIAVLQTEQHFRITIADNGIGFKLNAARHSGMGLGNLQKRALLLGGETRINSAPGRGTRVTINLPYRKHEQPDV